MELQCVGLTLNEDGTVDNKLGQTCREVNWLDILDDFLNDVTNKFVDIKDYIRFGAVCKSWHSIYASNLCFQLPTRQLPFLIIPSEHEDNRVWDYTPFSDQILDAPCFQTHNLYVISSNRVHSNFEFKVRKDDIFCGSSEGWLFIVHKYQSDVGSDVCLLNPFLSVGNEIELPPLDSLPPYHGEHEIEFFYENDLIKAVLSANPASNDNYVVLAINGNRRLVFFEPRDNVWRPVGFGISRIMDVIYYRDVFYAVSIFSEVYTLDVSDFSHPKQLKIQPPPGEDPYVLKYLVNSSGDLLLIRKVQTLVTGGGDEYWECEEDYWYTTGFEVFKLDAHVQSWDQVTILGGQAVFLGSNSSISVSAINFPGCKPNCIYFTDDVNEAYGAHDLGIFNMEDGSIEPHYFKGHPPEERPIYQMSYRPQAYYPPPIWIEPTHYKRT